ncbi:lytic transglycosylase domain-containing protein [Thermomonas paludicola]|uniref:lytic transglycosylase domain-containing protein n=1 Tax=Thermomonas paludicola TaxID=2884874 RepID=UPI002114BAA6|nr:lytic transglycosylase domain-containing protein [Thermomonas paludicola]
MKGRVVILLLLALAMPAMAGKVYRCDSGDGATSYTNKRVPGAQCRLMGNYSNRHVAAARPRVVAPPTRAVVVEPAPPPAQQVAVLTAPVPTPVAPPPRLVRGQVYAYLGKDGVRNYTSVRPAGVAAASIRTIQYSFMETCYACGSQPGLNFSTLRLNTTAYQDEIAAAAREQGVEEAIVRAIIHAESAFNPRALSRVGAQGLMQLMPATARRFGVTDAFNAGQNIRGGVQYLAWLLKRFNGNVTLAAAGYNAGEGAVDKYGGVPPYSETQRYVQRVGVLAERYRGAVNPVASPLRGGLSAR